MNVFHHHLEPVEAPRFGNLDFGHKALRKVLENDAIRSSKKGKNMLYEMSFVIVKFLPVGHVLSKVDFIHGPETSHLIFVHLPDVVVLDGQDDEAVGVLLKERLRQDFLSLSAIDDTDL